jgi:hypothetical protein
MIYGTSLQSIPLYLISVRQKSPVSYFAESGIFWCSNWSGIFTALLFYHEKHLEKFKKMRGATRHKRAWVAWPTNQAAPPWLIWPSCVSSSPYFYGCLHFIEKGCYIFPIIFWGGSGGKTLLPPSEGLICCCCQREIAAIIATGSSLA